MGNANAAVFLILFFVFVVWFYGPWQALCVDWARARMFEARNAIFDIGADNRLSFDSAEYQEIRSRIEGNIRFIHRMSWPTLVLIYFGIRRLPIVRPASMRDLIDGFSDLDVRAEVKKQTDAVEWVILRVMVFRSIILITLFFSIWIIWKCGLPVYRFCKSRTESLVDIIQVDSVAFDQKNSAERRTLYREHQASA
jgi:hypothetical protein